MLHRLLFTFCNSNNKCKDFKGSIHVSSPIQRFPLRLESLSEGKGGRIDKRNKNSYFNPGEVQIIASRRN